MLSLMFWPTSCALARVLDALKVPKYEKKPYAFHGFEGGSQGAQCYMDLDGSG